VVSRKLREHGGSCALWQSSVHRWAAAGAIIARSRHRAAVDGAEVLQFLLIGIGCRRWMIVDASQREERGG
jgi:hypothetical protein